MASILNVDQIGHSTSGTTAITIASDGTVTMPENDSGWITATLNSPFTNYGSTFANAEYRKINNIVCIQGLVLINGASNGSTIFSLPSGYCPKADLMFAGWNGNVGHARIDIKSNGDVQLLSQAANSWVTLTMTFMVA